MKKVESIQRKVSLVQWLREHPDQAAALRRRIAAEEKEADRLVGDELRAAALRLREELEVCKAGDQNHCFTSARLPRSKFEKALKMVEQAAREFDRLVEGVS